ncbi:MAG: WD40 repeat domain-containing protein [Rubripirellula sp.]
MKTPVFERTQDLRLPSGVLAAAGCANGERIIAGCMKGVFLVDVESGEHEWLYDHRSYVSSVAWTSETECVSAGYDGRVCWFDLEARTVIRERQLHAFWSWDLAVSPDRTRLASVTGQYLAGGYKYEPSVEREPSIRVVAVKDGETLLSLPHVPSVQAVAISPDNQMVAAGNLMGEVRVFDMNTGELVSQWTTPDFTSWGIIKSHSYLGGIFSMRFTPDGAALLLAGMGSMRDPMAGNGRQLWQKWDWRPGKPKLLGQVHKGESGEGLMEALAVHPNLDFFVMGGRLRGGDWNAAAFDHESGKRLATLKTGFRITETEFLPDASTLIVAGAQGQPKKKKNGAFPPFGRIELYRVSSSEPSPKAESEANTDS